MKYGLAKVKGFKGRHGIPLNQGEIHLGTKKVGTWSEDMNGGPMRIDFVSPAEQGAFMKFAKEYNTKGEFYCGAFFTTEEQLDKYPECVIENVLNDMLEAHQILKFGAKHAASHALVYVDVRLPGAPRYEMEGQTVKLNTMYYCPADLALLSKDAPVPPGTRRIIINEVLGQSMVTDDEAQKLRELQQLIKLDEKYKKLCKTKTVFLLVDKAGKETGYTHPQPFSAAVEKFLTDKYGDSMKEIVNKRYL